ncbi:ATP-binding protein [Emticicia sp. SJ17W-69]|uniref:PAS domain-containing hybrid sensor histidine kinase/response regulator n=1 Tax=Emticicia sp. SJ17W-69 TaxID=3421657 RepID=UPI003EB90916
MIGNGKGMESNQLIIANKKLAFQNGEKVKRAAELRIANKELAFQNREKEKRALELIIANKELAFQNDEKEKRADELIIANKELVFQNNEKEKRAAELKIANKELAFQNDEKEKRATELRIANYARSLIEASLDPLFTISPAGKITDLNNASVNITGVSREKLIGTDFFDYFTEPDKAREGYQEVFAKGFVADYPLTIRDHKQTDVLFNGSVYKDEQGNVLGVVVVARDITEQKRIENELIEARVFAELATVIAEEAQNKAENAVKSKQQFLSNMSHEIRTPMNAIIGFTKVVLKTDLTAKQKEYLTAIKISGDALIVLINDILDLAKVDAGKMSFEQVPFKMALSISAMLHLFETKIQEKNLKLVIEYDKKIPEVLLGDPVRLHQIILNLVSNAVKFTSKGKITVSVRLLNEDKEKVSIEFAVKDTGIGISDSKISTIFENFQQASSETSRIYGGTGLGLAIVKQLVEPQGGCIRVESIVDEGSIFSFTLSFQKTKADAELVSEMMEMDAENKHIKILVVEDIALNQLLMRTLLDDFGFDCDITANGKIAIEKLISISQTNSDLDLIGEQNRTTATKPYDIILMDLQMPEMNGFEATEYIRNVLKSDIPIMALTADVTTVDLEKCKAVGMNDYIAKPLDERLLYTKIVSLVKKSTPVKASKIKENEESEKVKCIDLSYLIHRTKANPQLMLQMISLYLEQTPPLIKAMKQSLKDENWDLLHSAVHKMIPSFSIMGISTDYENIAKKVQEYASIQHQTDGILDLVLKLENVCMQACEELEAEWNKIKNTK